MDETKLQQIHLNKLKIKQLEEENSELIDEMGLTALEPAVYTEGRYVVEVEPNLRFNADIATELFPLEADGTHMNLYEAKVSATLAKKHLTDEQYAACQKRFPKNKVTVKIV